MENKILGLGEGDHIICKNSTRIRIKLSKELIKNYNYNNFFLETDYIYGLFIDLYIKNKINLSKKELKELIIFPFRKSDIINFIIWLRKYNKKHKNKVSFYGATFESWINNQNLIKNVGEKSKMSYNLINLLSDYAFFNNIIDTYYLQYCKWVFKNRTGELICKNKKLLTFRNVLVQKMNEKIYKFKPLNNQEKEIKKYLLNSNIHIIKNNNQNNRDKNIYNMFQNIFKNKNNKSIVFFHNEHLTTKYGSSSKPLGYYLNKKFGKKYFALLFGIYNEKYNKNIDDGDDYYYNKLGFYNGSIGKKRKYNGALYIIKDEKIKFI